MSNIVLLPDGRIYFDAPYRIEQAPKHFHQWLDWEYQGREGLRCIKCGLVRLDPQPTIANYVQPAQIHNPHIYDPDTISEVYTEIGISIREAENEDTGLPEQHGDSPVGD